MLYRGYNINAAIYRYGPDTLVDQMDCAYWLQVIIDPCIAQCPLAVMITGYKPHFSRADRKVWLRYVFIQKKKKKKSKMNLNQKLSYTF